MSYDEWRYLAGKRPDATNKRGAATVCGVHGLILLPDNWNGKTFHAGFGDGWNTNVYDTDTWTDMESSGAIFLPATGYRYESKMFYVGTGANYWSSTPDYEECSWYLNFNDNSVQSMNFGNRFAGASVRLVQDY